jgi:hypothetical protein
VNSELNSQFSSGISLNFELNHWFRFKKGSNKFELILNQVQKYIQLIEHGLKLSIQVGLGEKNNSRICLL